MNVLKQLPRLLLLLFTLVAALSLDFLVYTFFNSCSSCTSFNAFVSSDYSLSAGIIASLVALFHLDKKI